MKSPKLSEGTAIDRSLRVLTVDDDRHIRQTLSNCLRGDGHHVEAVSTVEDAIGRCAEDVFDVAFLDKRLGTESGIDIIPDLLERAPRLKIIVITAYASIENAVEAVRRGAADYLPKPFSPAQVRLAVQKVTRLYALEGEVEALREDLKQSRPNIHLESQNTTMQHTLDTLRQVAESDASVLLRGESGTGKTVLARTVHQWSARADRPFAVVHAPSLPSELFESELFGHKKGAFTGATESNPGRVAQAEGGTLFLDEVGDLPLKLQPKLLRFIQDHEYERVGDPETRRADVRILSATNQDLEKAVEEGQFREDLLYRLNVIEVEVPPLRERPEDVLPLARQQLSFFAGKYNRAVERFTDEAEEMLRQHAWPGNVRELQNAVERAVILCQGESITPVHLPFEGSSPERTAGVLQAGASVSLETFLEEQEKTHIRRVIANTATLDEAADVLGIDPATLWRRRQKHGL